MSTQIEKQLELWKDIPEWEGRYQVSDRGRVRSLTAHGDRLPEPRLRKLSHDRYGYPTCALSVRHAVVKTYCVHRLVLLAFVGPRPHGLQTRHLDGDRTNNRLSNLVYGTPLENQADKNSHGTHVRGCEKYNAKLSAEDIEWIKAWRQAGYVYRQIGVAFSVASSRISDVLNGKAYL